MKKKEDQTKTKKTLSKKEQKDDILNIAHQFISYFEEVDRSENNDNSISNS